MCTVIILRRPGHDWPLLIAANRDEMQNRPWSPPARHWPDREHIVAGQDDMAKGTWLGLNNDRVVSALLNRVNSLGSSPEFRSRGELPLEVLDHAEAGEAAKSLVHLDGNSYKSFNLLAADSRHAFCLESGVASPENMDKVPGVSAQVIPEGLSMITAHGLNNMDSLRQQKYAPLFKSAQIPDPDANNWEAWIKLLSSRDTQPELAMNIETEDGFGTVSSSLIAIPSAHKQNTKPIWLFAKGPPVRNNFNAVTL